MLTASEPRHPPAAHLALVDRVAERIRPDDAALEPWYRSYCRQHRQRLAADLGLVGGLVEPGARVLEYGAIPLLLTAALAEQGYGVRALDLAPQRFAGAIRRLRLAVVRCDVETQPVPFAAESFDAVVFNELFEHLRIDPAFTLGEVHRVLRPGGSLVLSTPNLRSFRGLRNLLLRHQGHAVSGGIFRQYEKLRTLGHMGHVREYTAREVVELLVRLGFRVDKVVFRGGHGRGAVGLAERLAPSWRPFFALLASRAEPGGGDDAHPPARPARR